MKILYGVQGTGNGHISRANALSDELSQFDQVSVDWLVSGRPPSNLFQVQGHQRVFRGLTFSSEYGQVRYLKTITSNNLFVMMRDILGLELEAYDCLVTDYEPIISWAAKLQGLPTIGIGHQYAFNHHIPLLGHNWINMGLMRGFAPASLGLGLHWHHFNQAILPPICDVPDWKVDEQQRDKVVVYLPFENQSNVIRQLERLTQYRFFVYGPELSDAGLGHIQTRALSRDGFKQDLITSHAVITNAGFELISECLVMGIKVLAKPLHKQVEQLSNGEALRTLGYARVENQITTDICRDWLQNSDAVRITYPAVHKTIARWLIDGQHQGVDQLTENLWRDVEVIKGEGSTLRSFCPLKRAKTAQRI